MELAAHEFSDNLKTWQPTLQHINQSLLTKECIKVKAYNKTPIFGIIRRIKNIDPIMADMIAAPLQE